MSTFIVPVKDCYLTSPFGWRDIGYGKQWHQGVDLGKQPNTNVEILAAADGEVIRTGPLDSYGNVVMIKHSINGKRMDTNYAHLKNGSIKVKVGQKVKQGQVIGIMGNTDGGSGRSTGVHLHFEIHNGAWAKEQPNAINPEKYLTLYTKKEFLQMEKELKQAQADIKDLKARLATAVKALEKAAVYNSAAKADKYAEPALKFVVDNKIMVGDGKGNLNPKGAITRQDLAVLIKNMVEQLNLK